MPHIITLNQDRDTVKRLLLDDRGGATLQAFTHAGRVEIHLTAEELEIVRTGCDCAGRDERALDALTQEWRPSRGTLGAGQGVEYPQAIGESLDAIQRHLDEADRLAREPDVRRVNLDLDSLLIQEDRDDDIPF